MRSWTLLFMSSMVMVHRADTSVGRELGSLTTDLLKSWTQERNFERACHIIFVDLHPGLANKMVVECIM